MVGIRRRLAAFGDALSRPVFAEVIQRIREKRMIPGLWLEIEVMGINCPLARELPDDWFFLRDGKRVIDHGRYQLDFRNPEVRAHADQIVERLVREFGIGYLKMDYNINAGPGTDQRVRCSRGRVARTQSGVSRLGQGRL